MKIMLEEFEIFCTTPGVESGKARSYHNAIKYLCEFLEITIINEKSLHRIKEISDYVYDLNSDFYKSLLTFLKDRRQSSYLEKGYIRAALPQFFTFLSDNYFNNLSAEVFPDSDQTDSCIEGAKVTVTVNKYERSAEARKKCIDHYGCYCHICGMNFEDIYGEIGKGFIHVHHIVAISEINEEYSVNPETDLIPVCPNCHAMLHRKLNDKYISISELKHLLANN